MDHTDTIVPSEVRYSLDDFPVDLIKAKVNNQERDLPHDFAVITSAVIRNYMKFLMDSFKDYKIFLPAMVTKDPLGAYFVTFGLSWTTEDGEEKNETFKAKFNYPIPLLEAETAHPPFSILIGSSKNSNKPQMIGKYHELLGTAKGLGKTLEQFLTEKGIDFNMLAEIMPEPA